MKPQRVIESDLAIIGAGMGGVAAALDEHPYSETFGVTRSYQLLRNAIRKAYQDLGCLGRHHAGEPPV